MYKEILRILGLPDDPRIDYVDTTAGVKTQDYDVINRRGNEVSMSKVQGNRL